MLKNSLKNRKLSWNRKIEKINKYFIERRDAGDPDFPAGEINRFTPPSKAELQANERFQTKMNNKFLAEGDEFSKLSESVLSIQNEIIQNAMKNLKTGISAGIKK